MKSALLGTAAHSATADRKTFYADAEEKEGGEEAKRFSALMDMIADACSKMDEGSKRMDARMDAMEEKFSKADADRADAAKKDEDEKKEAEEAKSDAAEEEKKEEKRDDADDEDAAMDSKKDDDEKEKKEEKAEADSTFMTRAEADILRKQIAALNIRAPQIVSDADRERFASIQEQAEPVFQAFGDRAPAPLEGETPTQYKRRLGSKMQSHSPNWSKARLSAIADDTILDVAIDQIYADATSVGRRGADVPAGNLRANKTTTQAGHTRIEYIGDPRVMTDTFSGNMQRA